MKCEIFSDFQLSRQKKNNEREKEKDRRRERERETDRQAERERGRETRHRDRELESHIANKTPDFASTERIPTLLSFILAYIARIPSKILKTEKFT